jgi:hypothetical protein
MRTRYIIGIHWSDVHSIDSLKGYAQHCSDGICRLAVARAVLDATASNVGSFTRFPWSALVVPCCAAHICQAASTHHMFYAVAPVTLAGYCWQGGSG